VSEGVLRERLVILVSRYGLFSVVDRFRFGNRAAGAATLDALEQR
jgi:hypothetical protein